MKCTGVPACGGGGWERKTGQGRRAAGSPDSLHGVAPAASLPPWLWLYNHLLGSYEPIASLLLFKLFQVGFYFSQVNLFIQAKRKLHQLSEVHPHCED